MNLREELTKIAETAQGAYRDNVALSKEIKNKVLLDMAVALLSKKSLILTANRRDIKAAVSAGFSGAFVDRLRLDVKRIREMSDSLVQVAKLPDPVGELIKSWRRPNGLCINKVRVPIGVIAIIYESRPNVTADCVGLCLKSGNSVILRGGSEALQTNLAIYKVLKAVLKKDKVAEGLVNMVKTKGRRSVDILLKMNDYIDLVMPRGGEGLIRRVIKSSRIPVIKHYKGICHVYVDEFADLNMAESICFNAKVQRPGVCNAMESMLVHRDVAARFLPGMAKRFKEAKVQMRGCPMSCSIIKGIRPATDKDYRREYLDLIVSIKVVDSLKEAIKHINEYGSHHSDAIVTDSKENSAEFLMYVDSACVYVNASTRFTDGYQFGLGAEIGISTDKLHARGPMALEELTTYKYNVIGRGQVRQ
jgi:glutamate-5-semialdehyde dehydrogenase